MSSVTVEVKGAFEIQQKLLTLGDRVAKKVVRGSLVEGGRLIRDDARARAPEWHGEVSQGHPAPGTLKKSIVIKYVPERSRGGTFTYLVGVRHGKKFQKMGKKGVNRDAFYWWWVEFGHYTRSANISRAQQGRGRASRQQALAQTGALRFIPGQRFMRNAFATKREDALRTIMASMQSGVMSVAKEAA